MENKLTMKANEVLLWISVIILALAAYFFNSKYSIVLIFWTIIIISAGNAKRIYSAKYLISATIIRRSMYVIPFVLPLFIDFKLDIIPAGLLMWVVLGVALGMLLVLPKISEWRLALSKDMVEFTPRREKVDYYTEVLMLIGAAIGEEIYFRNFVIGYIDNVPYILSILLSCGLFFLNHFGVKWNNHFSLYDYAIQVIFGVFSALLFIFSKSILPSMAAHIVYNSPLMVLSIKSYLYHHMKKEA